MDEFVAECRREWKRLGVSGSTADEMAAELEADLHEASLEDVLGRDAADAAAFARRWATERGVARQRKTGRIFAAAAALAIVPIVIGAVLVIHDPDPATALPTARLAAPPLVRITARPADVRAAKIWVASTGLDLSAPGSRDSDTLGIVLLIVGLAVLVPATLLSSGRLALNR